jgi:hypothetical protein
MRFWGNLRDNRGIVSRDKRKVLYAGIDAPWVDPRGKGKAGEPDLSRQLSRLKSLPFDGVTVQIIDPDPKISFPQNFLGNNLLGPTKHDYRTFEGAIPQLRQLQQTPLRDNFLPITTGYWFASGKKNPFDWFNEDRWRIVENNLRVYAQIAKQSGVIRGFTLDIEPYARPTKPGEEQEWAYSIFSTNTQYNLVNNRPGDPDPQENYRRRVRECGRRFQKVLEEKLPGAPILLYLGYGMAQEKSNPNNADLFPHFVDGIIEQMDRSGSKGYVIDGYEGAYKYNTENEYRGARDDVRKNLKRLTALPQLYDRYVRVGFGKWLDAGQGADSAWNASDAGRNFYRPDSWEQSMKLALDNTDEYVWIWSGGQGRVFPMTYGRSANVPTGYLDALRRAKR